MYRVSNHPAIVRLYESLEDTSNLYLAMELCRGGELFDAIISRGSYTERDAAAVMKRIVSGVAHLHSMDIVHRDLKPENFLLHTSASPTEVKLTDFGLARHCGEFDPCAAAIFTPVSRFVPSEPRIA